MDARDRSKYLNGHSLADAPLVEGGQGRTGQEVQQSAVSFAGLMFAAGLSVGCWIVLASIGWWAVAACTLAGTGLIAWGAYSAGRAS